MEVYRHHLTPLNKTTKIGPNICSSQSLADTIYHLQLIVDHSDSSETPFNPLLDWH